MSVLSPACAAIEGCRCVIISAIIVGSAEPVTAGLRWSATTSPTLSPSGTPTPEPSPTPTSPSPTPAVLGDANCDARLSAADLVAQVAEIAAGEVGPCGADVDGSGTVDAADIAAAVELLFVADG